ncbi:hypothetical protein CY35_05G058400 [Sphagnum magellanicum]|nr:hypothetical protein CY35_05G058400 [Sphagnum magellanicum]KAH9562175.1 hypothetical protein CY35_05G058400 [Sphagnum magellanicum]
MTEVADGSQVAMLAQQQPVSSVLDNGRPEGLVETVQQQGSSVNPLLDSFLGKKNLHMKGGEAEEMGAAAEQLTGMVETNSQPVLLEGIDNIAAVDQEVVNGGDTQKPKADDEPGVSPQESIEVNKEGDTFMEETPLEMKELETEKMNLKESEVVEQNMCMVKVDKACNNDESINVHKTQGEEEEQGKVQESRDGKMIEEFDANPMLKAPVESGTEMLLETAVGAPLQDEETTKHGVIENEKMKNQDKIDKIADIMVDEMGDKIADRMADEMADKVADRMADEMADEIADRVVDEMADKIVDRMADEMADKVADRMADEMADEIADRIADEMADKIADEMAAELADELAEEMVDEVIEADDENVQEGQEIVTESMDDVQTNEAGEMEEEEQEEDQKEIQDDGAEGTLEEQMEFVEELEHFFKQRNMEYKPPKFYGLELNVLKLWRVVTRLGGHDHVTASKLWRTVGEEFKPPKTCTTISWSFRGFYEKALLDYERYKTGVPGTGNIQRPGHMDSSFLQMDSQGTGSPTTPTAQVSAGGLSGSGRARRDSAARAMQGWHSQRTGNGETKDTNEKGSGGKHTKKEKKLTSIAGTGVKRKGTPTVLERAVKAVRAQGRPRLREQSPPINSAGANTGKRSLKQESARRPVMAKQSDGIVTAFEPPIVDEGPKADWVKINVHKHVDCFEIYALVPGLAREEVRIQCEPGGRLVIAGMPEDPDNPWGVTPFRKVISLPSRIDAHQTSAVVTLYGQLYVRVPIAESKSS